MLARPVERSISPAARRKFLLWTLAWWGGVGVCALLFYLGALDFVASAKISLYGISIWLNGWLLALVAPGAEGRSKLSLYHDCLVIWMLSYAMTNVLWEIPWVIFSPHIFSGLGKPNETSPVSRLGFGLNFKPLPFSPAPQPLRTQRV